MAKYLDEFVAWLLGRHRQVDVPGGGRSFRRRCEPLWQLWPLSPIIDEVHEVIFVDGIHLSRGRVSEALCMRFNPQSRRRVRNNDCCVPEEA